MNWQPGAVIKGPEICLPMAVTGSCSTTTSLGMCVIFWTTEDDRYDVVIASNRDEFLSRPTLGADWHDFNARRGGAAVLSARDSTGGGTWLGVTRSGAFATLTNYTELSAPLPEGLAVFESRGRLVRDWLTLQTAANGAREPLAAVREQVASFLHGLVGKLDRYPGFNLLVGAVSSEGTVVGYITNRTPTGELCADRTPDVFTPSAQSMPRGMSNSVLTQPWNKVQTGCAVFQSTLDAHAQAVSAAHSSAEQAEDMLVESLFDLLWTPSDPPPTQRSELRNSVLIPPLPLPTPLADGRKDWYGTRTSTVILIAKTGAARLVERDCFALRKDHDAPVLVNGPPTAHPSHGRSSGQRAFSWSIHFATTE